MSSTVVMVGTRKGLWIGRSDEGRRDWSWTGPHFPMEEVYSCMVDTRGDEPRLLAGAGPPFPGGGGFPLQGRRAGRGAAAARRCQLQLARSAGLALRRPRRDLAGD